MRTASCSQVVSQTVLSRLSVPLLPSCIWGGRGGGKTPITFPKAIPAVQSPASLLAPPAVVWSGARQAARHPGSWSLSLEVQLECPIAPFEMTEWLCLLGLQWSGIRLVFQTSTGEGRACGKPASVSASAWGHFRSCPSQVRGQLRRPQQEAQQRDYRVLRG